MTRLCDCRPVIPACTERCTQFLYTPHFGASDPILRILKRRLHQAMHDMDMPDPKTTGVVLLGRGSSDRMANGDVAKMARWLWEETEHELVDIAFTGITYPRLEQVVQWQLQRGVTQIAVLPYYLFTGRLIERIKRQVARLNTQYPQVCFALSSYFGFEDEIYELVEARVVAAQGALGQHDAGLMPCDGCKYRLLVEDLSDGHRHVSGDAHVHVHGGQS